MTHRVQQWCIQQCSVQQKYYQFAWVLEGSGRKRCSAAGDRFAKLTRRIHGRGANLLTPTVHGLYSVHPFRFETPFFFFLQGIDEAATKDQEDLDAAKAKHGAKLTAWAEDHGKKRNVRTLLSTMHEVSKTR